MSTLFFMMREGRESKMFTLWSVRNSETCHGNERFLTNLSTDRAKAWKKAEDRATRASAVLLDEAVEDLNDIVRGDDVLRFGRHIDKRIAELPDTYLLYVAKGAPYQNRDGYECFAAPKVQIDLAQAEAVKRGLYVEHEGRLMSVRLRDAIVREASGWGHHFEDKTKVELTLTLLKCRHYDNAFGTVWIEIYEDQDGRKFEYKGSAPPSVRYFFDESEENEVALKGTDKAPEDASVFQRSVNVGESITVKATTKSGSYRDRDVTYLQRIKIVG